MFVGDEESKPSNNDATTKASKDLLHRLTREQAISTREDYDSAVRAYNGMLPFRGTDPEVSEILKAMERTFPTMPPFGEV
jgi:hypothetical protein